MIMHCVFLNLAEDADIDRLMEAYVMIGEVLDDIDGVYDYAAGPNRDFENKSPAYESGFVITFASKEALDAYAEHPRHKARTVEITIHMPLPGGLPGAECVPVSNMVLPMITVITPPAKKCTFMICMPHFCTCWAWTMSD